MSASTPALVVPALGRKGLTVDFSGGDLSSDAGFIPLALADQQLGLTAAFATAITDFRDPEKVKHALLSLVRERVYLIGAGYADANDAQTLRHDPLLNAALGQAPDGDPLAGQSTLSRFENSITDADLRALRQVLLDVFLARCGDAPQELVLDLDPFVDPAHGQQQGVLFNGYYDTYCYLPLYLCGTVDGGREYVLGALLRSGHAAATEGARLLLRYVVRAVRARFPELKIIVRGDCAFGVRKMLVTCRYLRVDYCFGIAKNAALQRLSASTQVQSALAAMLRRRYRGAGAPSPRAFGQFRYRAKTWRETERTVVKSEVTQGTLNPRFVGTSLQEKDGWTPRRVYCFYTGRGNPENRIKEFKVDLQADRLSCELHRANQFRLLLHVAAYHLFQRLQDTLQALAPDTEWARAQVSTVRTKLLKIAARVRVRCRTVRVQLPTCFPYQALWQKLGEALQLPHPVARSG